MAYKLITSGEAPTYGEELESGELFLDGTDSLTSSDNRKPVVDNVDFIPAVETIDGIDYEPAESKWPGDRGTYGFFGEYENVIGTATQTLNNATLTEEGGWNRVDQVSDTALGAINYTYSALSTHGYFMVIMRRGDVNNSDDLIEVGAGYCTISWGSKIFAFHSLTDKGSYTIGDNIAVFRFITQTTGETKLNIRASGVAFSAGHLEYSYFMNPMVVDLDYPVPYTPGTHEANKLQFDKDWATSDEWTIEGWVYFNNSGTSKRFFDTRANSSDTNAVLITSLSSNIGDITFIDSGATTSFTINNFTISHWMHLKIIIKGGIGADVYVDGGAVQSFSNTDILLEEYAKSIVIGNTAAYDRETQGYISDIRITPTADTSTDHYDSGLPYYNPDKTYGKNALWSIDDKGHFSGQFDNAGRIIEEYELDGQHVTKWDTGRMEISGEGDNVFSSDNKSTTLQVDYVEVFINYPKVLGSPGSSISGIGYTVGGATSESAKTHIFLKSFSSDGAVVTGSCVVEFQAIGRWK